MHSPTIVPFLLRCALIALLVIVAFGAAFLGTSDPQSADAAPLIQLKKLTAACAGRFGGAVAVSGDTAVVGARSDNAAGDLAGAACVFQRDHGGLGNWGEVKKLTASDAQAGDFFGESVAVSGNTAVVGAFGEDAEGGISANFGAAYVLERDQGGADNWGEVTKLTASDAEFDDRFGESVAIGGDTVIVGTGSEATGGINAGAAYVFHRDEGGPGNWGEVKKLMASDAQAGDNFGWSAALSGDTALIGAFGEDGAAVGDVGAAYVFARDQGGADNWGEVKKVTASDAEIHDRFGYSVALSGDTAVVGAYYEDNGGSFFDNFGAAYVFGRDEGGPDNWGEVKKLTASDAEAGDYFGSRVAVSGDTAVVGANFEFPRGGLFNIFGAAYFFARDQGGVDNWGEVNKLLTSDDSNPRNLGLSVAVSGNTAVVGANGAAYIFQELSVGGVAELPEVAGAPLEAVGSSDVSTGWVAGIAAIAVGASLAAAGWYARRRWLTR